MHEVQAPLHPMGDLSFSVTWSSRQNYEVLKFETSSITDKYRTTNACFRQWAVAHYPE